MSIVRTEIEGVVMKYTKIEEASPCALEYASKNNPKIYPQDHQKFADLNGGHNDGRLGIVEISFPGKEALSWFSFALKPSFTSTTPEKAYYLFFCPPGIIKRENNPSVIETEGDLLETLKKGSGNQGSCD